ncbi:hypothetical protein S83_024035, partial [Arachis hypogaea]
AAIATLHLGYQCSFRRRSQPPRAVRTHSVEQIVTTTARDDVLPPPPDDDLAPPPGIAEFFWI